MSPATEEILHAALALPEQERSELIEELLAAQPDPDGPPFDPSWLEEIRRRSAEIDGGGIATASWEEVRARARGQLKGEGGG